jgi:tetratricopeptide (TPR) repeat protein
VKKGELLRSHKRYIESEECYNRALDLEPNNAIIWYMKGQNLKDQGKDEESIECYNRALDLEPKRTNTLVKDSEPLPAHFVYIDDKNIWNEKGVVLARLGRNQEALECYEKILALDPKLEYAWINKGQLFDKQGKHEEAIKCYDNAIQVDQHSLTAWNYNVPNQLALSNLKLYNEAIECYDKSLSINPNNFEAWNNK